MTLDIQVSNGIFLAVLRSKHLSLNTQCRKVVLSVSAHQKCTPQKEVRRYCMAGIALKLLFDFTKLVFYVSKAAQFETDMIFDFLGD